MWDPSIAPPGHTCGGCGANHYRRYCPAADKACNTCGKIGHLGRVCRDSQLEVRKGKGKGKDGRAGGGKGVKAEAVKGAPKGAGGKGKAGQENVPGASFVDVVTKPPWRCPDCRIQISPKAGACPQCRKPRPKGPKSEPEAQPSKSAKEVLERLNNAAGAEENEEEMMMDASMEYHIGTEDYDEEDERWETEEDRLRRQKREKVERRIEELKEEEEWDQVKHWEKRLLEMAKPAPSRILADRAALDQELLKLLNKKTKQIEGLEASKKKVKNSQASSAKDRAKEMKDAQERHRQELESITLQFDNMDAAQKQEAEEA